MKFYAMLCGCVAAALILTPAIALTGVKNDQKDAASAVSEQQTTETATEIRAEIVTTDDE